MLYTNELNFSLIAAGAICNLKLPSPATHPYGFHHEDVDGEHLMFRKHQYIHNGKSGFIWFSDHLYIKGLNGDVTVQG